MSEHTGHIVPSKLNWLVFLILIAATCLTAWVATVDLGTFHHIDLNTVVALFIATCKASIVVLIFMQVKYTNEKMTKPVLLFAIAWLILLLFLSLTDYSSRFAG